MTPEEYKEQCKNYDLAIKKAQLAIDEINNGKSVGMQNHRRDTLILQIQTYTEKRNLLTQRYKESQCDETSEEPKIIYDIGTTSLEFESTVVDNLIEEIALLETQLKEKKQKLKEERRKTKHDKLQKEHDVLMNERLALESLYIKDNNGYLSIIKELDIGIKELLDKRTLYEDKHKEYVESYEKQLITLDKEIAQVNQQLQIDI